VRRDRRAPANRNAPPHPGGCRALDEVLTHERQMSRARWFRSLRRSVPLPAAACILLNSCEIQRPLTPSLRNASLVAADSAVLQSPPLPEPMPTFGTTLVHDTFGETSLLGLLASYLPMVGTLGDYMTMDPTGGPKGTTALRIDWPRTTSCQDDWSGIEHAVPGAPTEIYVQFSVRYSPGFLFDWVHTGSAPCVGTEKKLFLLWSGDNVSRFIYVMDNLTLAAGSDHEAAIGAPRTQNTGAVMSAAQYGNGTWHRVTFHFKQSSTTTRSDGFFYGWIDGVERWAKPQWASGSVGGWVDLKMPSTFNAGSPANQSEWMSDLTVWKP